MQNLERKKLTKKVGSHRSLLNDNDGLERKPSLDIFNTFIKLL